MSTEEKRPFGAWLREEMLRQNYEVDGPRAGGRTQLAKKSGISLSIISRILNENRVPDLPALRAIGKALGYSLGQMMVFAGVAEPDELLEPVVQVSQATLDVPRPPVAGPGVRVEQYDDTHLRVDVAVDTGLTMDEIEEALGKLSPHERGTVETLQNMRYEPAEIVGAVLFLRGYATRLSQQEDPPRKEA